MPEWLLVILVGGVILSLVGIIYKLQSGRVTAVEDDMKKRPKAEEVLSFAMHSKICRETTNQFLTFVKEQHEDLKAYFDMKIENEIMRELRKLNGGK
jgi:hypothetical protein